MICFFYVKLISVKSCIVVIKKLFWIIEMGIYSVNWFVRYKK